jgi:hypothetical protein
MLRFFDADPGYFDPGSWMQVEKAILYILENLMITFVVE